MDKSQIIVLTKEAKHEERFITIRNLDQAIPRQEWMKPPVLNEEHKSPSVPSLCES